ncbi:DNA polymerase III subunit gamma and tau [Cellulosimicrobium terreum]|nr:DNA polymerase III subunit gamma and tau [Cellulosimicrobium terreum]
MSTALYRRYRPETFAEVIGQEHVTAPLMQALRSGRVNHAYLFSGPRGCGKTTSARILARTLNCVQNTPENPIDTPCGQCESCVELARGGPGSLDVVEIDAASHNGVDDARELRERAAFAPARDRYKIFILDEAHMVTPQGFNALLKLVEEPPEHVKFVFATTEPDKVIGTIRSRTHHYPFRLVPPDVLGPYLEELCAAEGVSVGSGVFPLVTRAGGGSVRDSLSVMDQLIAGAENGTVEYERAVALLGFTHATLLDDVTDALAARDGASIFRVVDQVIATGHEPRRFVEDVLERLRDLIVIAVSGDEAAAVLRDQPSDQLARMRVQAQNLGVAELSRAADLANAALTEMSGATSPRLHLELLVARLLLPGADDGAAGFAARLDRLERGGLGATAGAQAVVEPAAVRPGAAGPVATVRPVATARPVPDAAGSPSVPAQSGAGSLTGAAAVRAALRPARPEPVPAAASTVAAEPADEASAPSGPVAPEAPVPASADLTEPTEPTEPEESTGPRGPVEPAAEAPAQADEPGPAEQPQATEQQPVAAAPLATISAPTGATPAVTTEELRRRWPEVLETLRGSRSTWSLVSTNAQVAELAADVVYLAFPSPGLARTFASSRHTGAVQDAVYQTLGLQVRVEPRLAEDVPGTGTAASAPAPPSAENLRADTPPPGPSPSDPSPFDRAWPTDEGRPTDEAVPAPSGTSSGGARESEPHPPVGGAPRSASGRAQVVGAVGMPEPARGGVALQERPSQHPASSTVEASAAAPEEAPDEVATDDGADQAWLAGEPSRNLPSATDEAWLAGAVLPGPPPVEDDELAPAQAQDTASASAPTAGPGPAIRETPRQAAERREAERRAAVRPTVSAPDPIDDYPSDDDPDIVSTGLVGVQLVTKLLNGKVIDEIVDQGL